MKTIKVMSIIGLVWFTLLTLILLTTDGDEEIVKFVSLLFFGYSIALSYSRFSSILEEFK